MRQRKEIAIGGKPLIIETGYLAKQADGSCTIRLGDTVVIATACMDTRGGIERDFLPLTVDYREYTYAAGKIPGGFFKREGRPSEKEIITSRLIDRPLRPLFPEGYTSRDPDHLLLPVGGRRERSGHPGDQRCVHGPGAVGDPLLSPDRRRARRRDRRRDPDQPDQQPARRLRSRPRGRGHGRGGGDGRGRRQPALRGDDPGVHLPGAHRDPEDHQAAARDLPRRVEDQADLDPERGLSAGALRAGQGRALRPAQGRPLQQEEGRAQERGERGRQALPRVRSRRRRRTARTSPRR